MSSTVNRPCGQDALASRIPLVVILGPTAVGKTETAIRLAERLDGEIVSADSRLFYRGMDIGTAKPSLEDRRHIPHHLVDVVEPDETLSLAVFQQAARQAIAGIHARGRLPFLVGGSGQYIHALIHAWEPPEIRADPHLRQELEGLAEARGRSWLHDQLAAQDPQAAAAIDPRNLRRTVRALEVILLTGSRFSAQRRQGSMPYRTLVIGLIRPRPELYARIDARIEAMFQAGFLEEVHSLLDKGISPALPAMSSIGYRECAAVIQGRIGMDEAITLIKRQTRTFVRRQANWFKIDDPGIHWYLAGQDHLDAIEVLIRDLLKGS